MPQINGRFRIYSSRSYLPPGGRHVTALYPFWGRASVEVPRPDFADELLAGGTAFLELTDLAHSDAAVFPEDAKVALRSAEGAHRARSFVGEAREAGKPVVFFLSGDATDPFPIDGVTVLRMSLHRSRRRPREFAQPAFHEDLLEYEGGEVPLRRKRPRPTVGFCGVALTEQEPATRAEQVRRAFGAVKRKALVALDRPVPQDVFVRAQALERLRQAPEVEAHIVMRDEHAGGAVFPSFDRARWERVRREYVDNMLGSDYVLCARGVGNFSYRLYETLCMGRIPVFVDTDCVLPYDFALDWRDYCVWVERGDVDRIGERVAAFHEGLSDGDFLELQRRCRRLWEEYLSPLGFFANFHRHFS